MNAAPMNASILIQEKYITNSINQKPLKQYAMKEQAEKSQNQTAQKPKSGKQSGSSKNAEKNNTSLISDKQPVITYQDIEDSNLRVVEIDYGAGTIDGSPKKYSVALRNFGLLKENEWYASKEDAIFSAKQLILVERLVNITLGINMQNHEQKMHIKTKNK